MVTITQHKSYKHVQYVQMISIG